jgi:hypothetical protein
MGRFQIILNFNVLLRSQQTNSSNGNPWSGGKILNYSYPAKQKGGSA